MPGSFNVRVSMKLAAAAMVAAVATAACAPASTAPSVPVARAGSLVVDVVDSLYDAGRGPAVALDDDGNPAVSYLLYQPKLAAGEIPPPVLAGQPQPPSVVVATEAKGIWSRTAVPPQPPVGKTEGLAPEVADQDGLALPGVRTGLAVGSDGTHHVAWSTPGGLFYDLEEGGQFGGAQKVAGGATTGGSVAVGGDGVPWIAFYASGSLMVAHLTGGSWQVDRVGPATGAAESPARTTGIAMARGDQPVVGYGNDGTTMLARRGGGVWSTQPVPGDGGYAVSVALDGNGNAQLAYADANGGVHHARQRAGAPWETTDLAPPSSGPAQQAGWGTGIAVDDRGTQYVTWAGTSSGRIVLATNAGGDFQPQPIPGDPVGATPALAVSPDGTQIALAWFDTANANLDVARSPSGGLALAHPLPTLQPPPTGGPSASPTATASGAPPPCEPAGTTVTVTAPAGAVASGFDPNCLAAPAGQAFKLEFHNEDPGVPHNVDIYDQLGGTHLGGANGAGETVTGVDQATYDVDALPAGQYYFQCDIHPTTMSGTFVVAAG